MDALPVHGCDRCPAHTDLPAGVSLHAWVGLVSDEAGGDVATFADIDPTWSAATLIGDPEKINATDTAGRGAVVQKLVESARDPVGSAVRGSEMIRRLAAFATLGQTRCRLLTALVVRLTLSRPVKGLLVWLSLSG